jgi:hypothetical protein
MGSLFVGGPADGAIHEVRDTDFFRVPEPPPTPDLSEFRSWPSLAKCRIVEYRRHRFRAGDREWSIFAPREMADAEIMDRLIAGYRPGLTARDAGETPRCPN